jgi:hypothetical protein
MVLHRIVAWSAVLLLAAVAAVAARGDTAGAYCANAQSPRDLDRAATPSPYQLAAGASFIKPAGTRLAVYLPRPGGAPQTLHRCGQHYHLPIENPQGCENEAPAAAEAPPPPGTRIEIHTVYAANPVPPPGCDPETLACCTEGPFLVRAFSATVKAGGGDGPIEPPDGLPLAEWSGSTTGAEAEPGECKPAAQWSFRLGCGFTVSEAQVKRFRHPDPARPLQSGDRVSRDLTLVQR